MHFIWAKSSKRFGKIGSRESLFVQYIPVAVNVFLVLDNPEEVSYIVLLDDWEILRENIIILEKKLGGGQFGIVKQGLYSSGKNEPELVAVKMLKGKNMALKSVDHLSLETLS